MSASISPVSSSRAGLCPHGLSPSTCPICSGKGGMSGGAIYEYVRCKCEVPHQTKNWVA